MILKEWSRIEADLKSLYSDLEYALKWSAAREQFYSDHGVLTPPIEDIAKLRAAKDRYKGERIFVIGNGPSLNKTPLELLKSEYTFGVNRIYLLFDKIEWKPNFYTALDWRVAADCSEEINALSEMQLYFPQRFRGLLREGEDVNWYWHNSSSVPEEQLFSPDISRGIRGAGSVIGSAIQIAFHLGFDPIYLIGCDLSYEVPKTVVQSGPDKFGTGTKLYLESTVDDDPNHFDSSYFGRGRLWHDPNVPRMIEGHRQCRDGIESRGRRIYNATIGGDLEVYERAEFSTLLAGPPEIPEINNSRNRRLEVVNTKDGSLFVGDDETSDERHLDESDIVAKLFEDSGPGVMVDVGAHHGKSLNPFGQAGWKIYAFEPDPSNRKILLRHLPEEWNVSVDDRAVGEKTRDNVAFYSSPVSSGISSLAPFEASHEETSRVKTTTLSEFYAEKGISKVDFLKVDTEGYDLMVLKGAPWEQISPRIMLCEFEDRKTIPLGYNVQNMVDYVQARGYKVLVSEWFPIVRYGVKHQWRRLLPFSPGVVDSLAWGNLICYRESSDGEAIASLVRSTIHPTEHDVLNRTTVESQAVTDKSSYESIVGIRGVKDEVEGLKSVAAVERKVPNVSRGAAPTPVPKQTTLHSKTSVAAVQWKMVKFIAGRIPVGVGLMSSALVSIGSWLIASVVVIPGEDKIVPIISLAVVFACMTFLYLKVSYRLSETKRQTKQAAEKFERNITKRLTTSTGQLRSNLFATRDEIEKINKSLDAGNKTSERDTARRS